MADDKTISARKSEARPGGLDEKQLAILVQTAIGLVPPTNGTWRNYLLSLQQTFRQQVIRPAEPLLIEFKSENRPRAAGSPEPILEVEGTLQSFRNEHRENWEQWLNEAAKAANLHLQIFVKTRKSATGPGSYAYLFAKHLEPGEIRTTAAANKSQASDVVIEKDQLAHYLYLAKWAQTNVVSKATFLEHSTAQFSVCLLPDILFSMRVENAPPRLVDVYVQNPDTTHGGSRYAARIASHLMTLPAELDSLSAQFDSTRHSASKLTIHFYDQPSTTKAALLNESILSWGPYTNSPSAVVYGPGLRIAAGQGGFDAIRNHIEITATSYQQSKSREPITVDFPVSAKTLAVFEEKLRSVEGPLPVLGSNRVTFVRPSDRYEVVGKRIAALILNDRKIKRATVVQCFGDQTRDVVAQLLNSSAERVDLYLCDPDSIHKLTGDPGEAQRVISILKLYEEVGNLSGNRGRLKIHLFGHGVIPVIRGVLITGENEPNLLVSIWHYSFYPRDVHARPVATWGIRGEVYPMVIADGNSDAAKAFAAEIVGWISEVSTMEYCKEHVYIKDAPGDVPAAKKNVPAGSPVLPTGRKPVIS